MSIARAFKEIQKDLYGHIFVERASGGVVDREVFNKCSPDDLKKATSVVIHLSFKCADNDVWELMKESVPKYLQMKVEGYGVVSRVDAFGKRGRLREPRELFIDIDVKEGRNPPCMVELAHRAYKKMLKGNLGQPTLSNRFHEKVIDPLRRLTCGF